MVLDKYLHLKEELLKCIDSILNVEGPKLGDSIHVIFKNQYGVPRFMLLTEQEGYATRMQI